jgi:Txe/YoeB family toxin of Txe-Axe toxin-antitoxin module
MDPTSNEAPIHLPAPSEQGGQFDSTEKSAEISETTAATSAVGQPAARPATIPLPATPSVPQIAQPVSSNSNNPSQASDDTDLIEKEWVNKAKAIVEQTKNDPYKQSEELTVFKSDYMKKRYNRTIKLSK